MKLLVTGGCGFLGSNLAAQGIRQGEEVVVLDNLGRHGATSNLEWLKTLGQFRFEKADTRDAAAVTALISAFRPDAIFHLAGQVAMTTSLADPRLDFETNACGTFNILDAVRQHSPESAVLYSSTNKVYGDLDQYNYREAPTRYECLEQPNGFDESTALDFRTPYGCSKGAADQYVLDFARRYGLKTVVFRHSSMYGGRQFATADQGWVGWFCLKAVETQRGLLKEPFTISGNGKQVRDVLHAEDMIRLYFQAFAHMDAASGQAFNIGGGSANSLSLLELFAQLEALAGIKLRFTQLPPRASDQKVFIADITKARDLIGWYPQVNKEQGLRQMMEWAGSLAADATSTR